MAGAAVSQVSHMFCQTIHTRTDGCRCCMTMPPTQHLAVGSHMQSTVTTWVKAGEASTASGLTTWNILLPHRHNLPTCTRASA